MTRLRNSTPSARAEVITRRTYNRPLNDEGTRFETWDETAARVRQHQQWLWERAKGASLTAEEQDELFDLQALMRDRLAVPAGRTMWLGGTEVAKRRESSMFNCSYVQVETVHDVVDGFWLLLQGCGVGFGPVVGTLSGFTKPVKVEIIRSQKKKGDPKGYEANVSKTYTRENGQRVFQLILGDSAEAWSKAPGKILALKDPVDVVQLDFSEIRAGGERLKGYGWISSGDETISTALSEICDILNKRHGQLLTRMDILDVMNWLGTTLSSRRSAEIALMDFESPEVGDFITAKKDFWEWYDADGNKVSPETPGAKQRLHRQQSNNSIVFWSRPSRDDLRGLFDKIVTAGGSEPGFINGQTALKRAPWFRGTNPCGEILLGNRSFCNLVTPDWGKMAHMERSEALRAIYVIARANYRQTCVNLDDGILQRTWHELNEFLRLCGVGAAGIVKMLDHLADEQAIKDWLRAAREAARGGAISMADELGLPRPKAVTTVKPDGTVGKILDTTEGVHRPLGKYIFNNVKFSVHDPVVDKLRAAGYRTMPAPGEADSVIVTFPVAYEDVEFDVVDGKEVNLESAVAQLERYKLLMDEYVDYNCSVTVSYDTYEVDDIVGWILDNWDSYVGVSFIFRNDPTKTAEDLGYLYLPQEVVTKEEYDAYVATLSEVDLHGTSSLVEDLDDDCSTGACPIR
jgi:ribonucleoside-triphosphate reductase